MAFVRAGELDRRISIERAGSGSDDGYTMKAGEFAELAEVWCKVRPAPGTERFASGENAATAPTRFIIRFRGDWDPQVNPKDRIRYPVGGDRVYDIKSVNELGRREALEILAVARAD